MTVIRGLWDWVTKIICFLVSVLVFTVTWLYQQKSTIVSLFTFMFHNMASNHFIFNILICWYLKIGGYGEWTVDLALATSISNLLAALALDQASDWFKSTTLGEAISGTPYTLTEIPGKWVLVQYISKPIESATAILWPAYNSCTTERRCMFFALMCLDIDKNMAVPLFMAELGLVIMMIIFVIMVMYIKYLKTNAKIVKRMDKKIEEQKREIADLQARLQTCKDEYDALDRQHSDYRAAGRLQR